MRGLHAWLDAGAWTRPRAQALGRRATGQRGGGAARAERVAIALLAVRLRDAGVGGSATRRRCERRAATNGGRRLRAAVGEPQDATRSRAPSDASVADTLNELVRRTYLSAPSDLAAVSAKQARLLGGHDVVLYLIDYRHQGGEPGRRCWVAGDSRRYPREASSALGRACSLDGRRLSGQRPGQLPQNRDDAHSALAPLKRRNPHVCGGFSEWS